MQIVGPARRRGLCITVFAVRKELEMPDREELETILDSYDSIARRDRMLPWRASMDPSPETDEADEAYEADERSKRT